MTKFRKRTETVLAVGASTISGLAIIGILMVTLSQVLSRQFMGSGITGVVDLTSQFLMPTLVLFALTMTEKDDHHIRITAITTKLPSDVQRRLKLAGNVITCALVVAIIWTTANSALEAHSRGAYTSGDINVPLVITQSIAPIAFASLLIILIVKIVAQFPGRATTREDGLAL